MATASADLGFPSLLDVVKRMDPDGSYASITESLTHFNPLLQDAVFLPGNLPTGHRVTARTGLPSVAWRRFNEGVSPSRSKTTQYDETIGMLEGWSAVDRDEAKLNGEEAAFRASEDRAFLQQLNNTMETAFFYSNVAATPEQIQGLTPRLNSSTQVGSGKMIIKTDPVQNGSDQNSIWLIGWGPETVFGIYPKGTMGGIEAIDAGLFPWDPLGNGAKVLMWLTNWKWHVGLCVKDYRYISRCCNIDTQDLSGTADLIIPAMVLAWHKIYNINAARFAWYCNRTVAAYLHLQARNKTQYQLKVEEPGGEVIISMLGIPIRVADALTSTEASVS